MIVKIKDIQMIIDSEDLEIFKKYKWNICNKKGTLYILSFIKINGKRKTIYYSRVITNAPDNVIVDHIDGNTLDNRKCNLRFVNKKQNAQNMKSNKNSTSKYKGVSFDKQRKLWRVVLKVDMKQIYIGRFNLEKDAALAYNKSALQYFGEYARLNKIEEQ
jgi:hypothetical protein